MCSCSSSWPLPLGILWAHIPPPGAAFGRRKFWIQLLSSEANIFGSKVVDICEAWAHLGSSFQSSWQLPKALFFLGIGDQPSFVSWLWEFPQGDLLRRWCVNSCAAMLPCSIPPWMGLRLSTQHSLKTIKSSMYGSSCGSVPKPLHFLKGLSKSGPLRWMCWF